MSAPPRSPRRGPRRIPRRAAGAAACACVALLLAVLATAAPAHAATMASFRMAHFSPDTPAVDVYLTGFSGDERLVLPALDYGQVSTYVSAPPGPYTVSVRPAGTPTSMPAKVITSTELAEGAAYTFAAMGLNAELKTVVIGDDLGAPPPGVAKVRVINAASTPSSASLSVVDGPVLATDLPFGATSNYVFVTAGAWNLHLTGEGVDVSQQLAVDAGTVDSVVIVHGADGTPELTAVVDATVGVLGTEEVRTDAEVDAAATGGIPTGGINTGAGGLAGGADRSPLDDALIAIGVAASTALLAASLVLAVRRPMQGALPGDA